MLPKNQGSLGFSIIGGTDHSCVPFGANNPGIFISHVSTIMVFGAGRRVFACIVHAVQWPGGEDEIENYFLMRICISELTQVRTEIRW